MAQNVTFYGYGYYKALIGNFMLKVELTGQRGCKTNRSGRNGTDTVAGAASETFARWLHR